MQPLDGAAKFHGDGAARRERDVDGSESPAAVNYDDGAAARSASVGDQQWVVDSWYYYRRIVTRYACISSRSVSVPARSHVYFLHVDMGSSNARVDWDFAPMLVTALDDSVLNVHVLASGVLHTGAVATDQSTVGVRAPLDLYRNCRP